MPSNLKPRKPPMAVGSVVGDWRIVAVDSRLSNWRHVYHVECVTCGARAHRGASMSHEHGRRCPHPLVDEVTPYEQDISCQLAVTYYRQVRGEDADGCVMMLSEIAEMLGVSRERARQIEASALRKLRQAFSRLGIDGGSVSGFRSRPMAPERTYGQEGW